MKTRKSERAGQTNRPVVGLLLAVVSLLVLGCSPAFSNAESAEYWFSSDPDVELMRLSFTGGMLGTATRYRLFADGRVSFEKYVPDDAGAIKSLLERKERHVGQEALDAVLRHAVDGGMADLAPSRIAELRRLPLKFSSPDAATVWFALQLPNYRRAPNAEAGPVSVEWSRSGGLDSWVASYPDIAEFQCLRDLVPMVRALVEVDS